MYAQFTLRRLRLVLTASVFSFASLLNAEQDQCRFTLLCLTLSILRNVALAVSINDTTSLHITEENLLF